MIDSIQVSRRSLLTTGAALVGFGALGLAGCSTTQVAAFEAQWATIAGDIQTAVSAAVAYIPTIESIAATAASLFGPAYVTLVQAGSAAFNAVVQTLINVVGQLAPAATASLRRRLATSSPALPVAIGVTAANVKVNGWKSR